MTEITFDNVQSAVTPKAGNSELWFLSSAQHIIVIYVCTKLQKYLKGFSIYRVDTYITEITIFTVQRAITPKEE